MKKSNIISFVLFFLIAISIKAQNYQHGTIWVLISERTTVLNERETSDESLNRILQTYNCTRITPALPGAKYPENKRIYEIEYSGNDELFVSELKDYTSVIEDIYRIPEESFELVQPADVLWNTPNMWHLNKIQAEEAWNIQKGDENVTTAVIDTYFDPTHPDLVTQFKLNYSPDDTTQKPFNPEYAFGKLASHGTTVAGFVAGQTTDSGMVQPIGAEYCSIGYKTKLLGYKKGKNTLFKAWHASIVEHADVISSSMIDYCDPNNGSLILKYSLKEILDNGTVIVQGAGNGFCAGCYYNGSTYKMHAGCEEPDDFVSFSPPFPFSPTVDNRIILVTGTTPNDSLTRRVYDTTLHQYKTSTYHYMPEISVCSPGYDMWGIQPTKMYHFDTIYLYDTTRNEIRYLIDTTIVDNPHPFWNGFGGTSFAAPIVAGLAGLIKSQNPWLTSAEVQSIIKRNVDPVKDASLYQYQTGGRINAFKALSEVETVVHNYEICDSTEVTWLDTVYVKEYVRICRGSTLRVKSDVFFNNKAKVIVECGGRLIVDGGRLTGPPHNTWTGVLAYSDPKNN